MIVNAAASRLAASRAGPASRLARWDTGQASQPGCPAAISMISSPGRESAVAELRGEDAMLAHRTVAGLGRL